jgi:hypothetical protein
MSFAITSNLEINLGERAVGKRQEKKERTAAKIMRKSYFNQK